MKILTSLLDGTKKVMSKIGGIEVLAFDVEEISLAGGPKNKKAPFKTLDTEGNMSKRKTFVGEDAIKEKLEGINTLLLEADKDAKIVNIETTLDFLAKLEEEGQKDLISFIVSTFSTPTEPVEPNTKLDDKDDSKKTVPVTPKKASINLDGLPEDVKASFTAMQEEIEKGKVATESLASQLDSVTQERDTEKVNTYVKGLKVGFDNKVVTKLVTLSFKHGFFNELHELLSYTKEATKHITLEKGITPSSPSDPKEAALAKLHSLAEEKKISFSEAVKLDKDLARLAGIGVPVEIGGN